MKTLNRLILSMFVLGTAVLPVLASCHYGAGGAGACGGKVAFLLIALAAGYGVLVLSQSQTRPLDAIGRGVGGIILIVALIGLICMAACGLRCKKGGSCTYSPVPMNSMSATTPAEPPTTGAQ